VAQVVETLPCKYEFKPHCHQKSKKRRISLPITLGFTLAKFRYSNTKYKAEFPEPIKLAGQKFQADIHKKNSHIVSINAYVKERLPSKNGPMMGLENPSP
jgi:hypothetical protein